MFTIQKIKIDGFWQRFSVSCDFSNKVNVIIGRNGTGKTTFMDILTSILTIDLIGLAEVDFNTVEIVLSNEKEEQIIKVNKVNDNDTPFQIIDFTLFGEEFSLRAIDDERRYLNSTMRKVFEDVRKARSLISEKISVSSISVYRLRNDDDYEYRERGRRRFVSPVDYKLGEALKNLTAYQLQLARESQSISSELQKDVLISILDIHREKDTTDNDFDKNKEEESLIAAYSQLGISSKQVENKIKSYCEAIDSAQEKLSQGAKRLVLNDFHALESKVRTSKIVELSLHAKEKTDKIYQRINTFLDKLKEFIIDKAFSFDDHSGRLLIENEYGEIPYERLSSGEKQLLILFIETLLQKQKEHVFLADEPELSLHIAWQKKVIPAIRELNPNSQVIVATHSPEVASNYKDSIIDMEDLRNG